MNPECGDPVDFVGTGALNLYCSTTCRSRASTLRGIPLQQLAAVERTLADAYYMHGIPRDDLRLCCAGATGTATPAGEPTG